MIEGPRFASVADNPAPHRNRGNTIALRLAALLTFGVMLWFYAPRVSGLINSGRVFDLAHVLGDALLNFLLALAAVEIGGWFAQRRAIPGQSASGLFARAVLIAGVFALFILFASATQQVLDRSFGLTSAHAFHGQSRGVASHKVGDIAAITLSGLEDAFLSYIAVVPLSFLGLALLCRNNQDGRARADLMDCEVEPPSGKSVVPIAIAVAVTAATAGLTLTVGKQIQRGRQALPEHSHLVASVPVDIDFKVDQLRVAVKSAQWMRQPRAVKSIGATGAEIGSAAYPDRIYLEVTFENLAPSPRSVGRGEFRMVARSGESWTPLADDFPEILLGPAEKLTTRLIFEVPPGSAQLELVSAGDAAQTRIPIGDDAVGGPLGALCRALAKPWKS